MTPPLPRSTPRHVQHVLACTTALLLSVAPGLGHTEDVPGASAAERLVFINPHLAGMKAPTTLRYQFVRSDAAAGGSFKDSVELKLARGKAAACCSVSGSFLSGERAMRVPEVDDARSNPVLMYFLEYEVRQLQRSTKGGTAHFRQQIRLALVDKAELSPTRIEWGGRDVAATAVQISPFLDDPYRARFEREARKVYTFVMSDEVPGGVYQIRTRLPDAAAGTTAVEETLTLVAR
jgi:hypothetical protein